MIMCYYDFICSEMQQLKQNSLKMNELVIDKRIFLQSKKRSNTKTMLPQIKYPLNFNMNGSSILRKINEQIMAPKQSSLKYKNYQPPLSNILISKRITPINPEDSPIQVKRKQNHSYAPKDESAKKMQPESDSNLEDPQRKTSTSLSHRINIRAHEKAMINSLKEEVKNIRVSRTEEFTVLIGKANNNEDLIREILAERKIWKQIKWGEGIPHLKWVFSKERHNYKKMWSFTQTRAINHFQFNEQLTTKDNLIRNLQLYCQTKKMEVFTLTPVTFIIDFDDEYCEYNMKQFLSFFLKNDPRKNLTSSRKNGFTSYNFVTKFQSYMAWQNSDIKKKVNILSRPVNNSTYYSADPEPGYVWLLKPTGLNRGRGIEIFDNLEDLQKMLMDFLMLMNRKNYGKQKQKDKKKIKVDQNKNEVKLASKTEKTTELKQNQEGEKEKQLFDQEKQGEEHTEQTETKFCRQNFKLSSCSFVIQKYVERPFLIQNRKFDIRVWVLLTQNHNLYFFKEGYIRTSAEEFQLKDIHNYFIHLTNNAIQKNSSSYGMFENGNQLSFKSLAEIIGGEQTERIWERMKQITYMAFSSVNKKINQNHRKFCFELFGLDFIIDEELKVWLIEINENPCIECSSPLLEKLIPRMINDAFKLTIDQIFTERRPTEKAYPVPGYTNSESMWQLLGQLSPNGEYIRQKQTNKQASKEPSKEPMKQGKQLLKQSPQQLGGLQQIDEQNEQEEKQQRLSRLEVHAVQEGKN